MNKEYFQGILIRGLSENVFIELIEFTKDLDDTNINSNLVLLLSRWNQLETSKLRGILTFHEYLIEENKIADSLQDIIKELF